MRGEDVDHDWAAASIRRIVGTGLGELPTPLRRVPLASAEVLLKDESALPTGSLKHRHVASILCDALERGQLGGDTPIVGATGGAVAVAGAWFAALLGLPVTAIVHPRTSRELLARIESEGGQWRFAEGPPAGMQDEGRAHAAEQSAYFLDHFAGGPWAPHVPTPADEILAQLDVPPAWIVTGAATGHTSANIGERVKALPTKLAVVDPENSAYLPAWLYDEPSYATGMPSRVPGIGRPRVEAAFRMDLVDKVQFVPDPASFAAAAWLREHGIPAGPATGAAFWGACQLTAGSDTGSVVAIQGDAADVPTPPDLDTLSYERALDTFAASGDWRPPRQ